MYFYVELIRYFVLLKSVWKIWMNKESLIHIIKFIQRIIECMTRNVAIRSTVSTLIKAYWARMKECAFYIQHLLYIDRTNQDFIGRNARIWYFVNIYVINDKCDLLDKWKKCLVSRVRSERINQKTTFLLQNDYNELKQTLQQDEENLIFVKS